MRRPPTRKKTFRPRFAPGPWQPTANIPQEMRTMAPVLVRSHAFPKQDRKRTLEALRGAHQIDEDTFFIPREATQNASNKPPQFASGPTPVKAVTQAAQRLSKIQERVLKKYLGGASLTPAEAKELFAVRIPPAVDQARLQRQRRRGAYGPTIYDKHGGARQVPYFRQTPQHTREIIYMGRARAHSYGVRGGGRPVMVMRDPQDTARIIAARVDAQNRGRGFR